MVSHGLFLCALIWQLKGEQALDMRGFRQWQQLQLPGNASVTRLALRDQSWKAARPMLVLPEPP
jgi:hypothetical protein